VVVSTGPTPTHDGLVEELRELRERGLTGIRDAKVPDLAAAARLAGYDPAEVGVAGAIEQLIRKAIEGLGAGVLGAAAGYTFGTRPGFRDKPAHERREGARKQYGVSMERFRKAQERVVVREVADGILKLARPVAAATGARDLPALWAAPLVCGGTARTVTLRIGPVELLRAIDVVVASTNVYFELSHRFVRTLAAALRAAGAVRSDETGGIVDDVVARELDEALIAGGALGMAAVPGFVRVTTSGRLAERGIHRIFHAAVATPRPGPVRYDVEPAAISAAVRNTFRIATRLRATELPGLRSICFPLFGSGCGAIDRQQSLHWMLTALEQELAPTAPWDVQLISRGGSGLDLSAWARVEPPAG
jgi:O-acetyl-ADP-ribose deacetylase (regulator of RNase III)